MLFWTQLKRNPNISEISRYQLTEHKRWPKFANDVSGVQACLIPTGFVPAT